MTLEIILWFLAWIVLSETLFIYGIKKDFFLAKESWVWWKFFSFICGILVILINIGLVFGSSAEPFVNPHYINLFYEACVILVLGGFFYLNKLVVDYFNKK